MWGIVLRQFAVRQNIVNNELYSPIFNASSFDLSSNEQADLNTCLGFLAAGIHGPAMQAGLMHRVLCIELCSVHGLALPMF